jgi:hypothetical protein
LPENPTRKAAADDFIFLLFSKSGPPTEKEILGAPKKLLCVEKWEELFHREHHGLQVTWLLLLGHDSKQIK